MKAITIWQPWASLLTMGVKQYETRSWATSYRGPIAIHAAAIKVPQVLKKLFPYDECDGRAKSAFLDAVAKGLGGVYTTEELMETLNGLPTGSVIATAEFVNVWHVVRNLGQCDGAHKIGAEDHAGNYIIPSEMELALGDWTPGRYVWEFSDMKLIDPIPTKGKQGLWTWEGW